MSVSAVVSIWDKIEDWLSPLSSAVDAILRPVVSPIVDLADPILGDSDATAKAAVASRDLAAALEELATEHESAGRGTATDWMGDGAEKYRAHIAEVAAGLRELAAAFDDTADQLEDATACIEEAVAMVETIVRELIEAVALTLLASAALSVVTAGVSAAAGAAAASVEAGIASARIAALVTRIAAWLKKIADFLVIVNSAKIAGSPKLHLIAKIVLKGALKPGVSTLTGLTGDPFGESLEVVRDAAARRVDDYLETYPRPAPVETLERVIEEADERLPAFPGLD